MIVSIHQPHFLPWMGYVNKALASDVFVWLDSVPYRKNYYQNRARIKQPDDRLLWLTLPVHETLGTPIAQVKLAEPSWRVRVAKTLTQCYGKAPCFETCWPSLEAAMRDAPDDLAAVNLATFRTLLELLGPGAPRVVGIGDLPATSTERTLRLVEVCTALGATQYIAGQGGRAYLRVEEFERAGIEVIWQEFDPARVTYPQRGKTFVPGLSIVDCLFNVGPEETRRLAQEAWRPAP